MLFVLIILNPLPPYLQRTHLLLFFYISFDSTSFLFYLYLFLSCLCFFFLFLFATCAGKMVATGSNDTSVKLLDVLKMATFSQKSDRVSVKLVI